MPGSLRMLSLWEGEKIKDFVFEEEHVEIPLIAFDNDQFRLLFMILFKKLFQIKTTL